MNEGAVRARDSARWCEHCQAWGDHHTDRHPQAGEWPDAIPETAIEAFREGVWNYVEHKIVASVVREGLRHALPFLRAAHPEAGSEEGERLRDAARAFVRETGVAHPAIARIPADAPAAVRYDETRAALVALLDAHPETDRAPEDEEAKRLKSECCVCEKCGHVQAEPNWCHECGHRTSVPDWAKPLVDAFHERDELRAAHPEAEEPDRAPSEVETVARDLRALGDEWRADWSDFDGRTAKMELYELADRLDAVRERSRGDTSSIGGGHDRPGTGGRAMSEPKCAKGECDQKVRCAFYCWWKPTMRALNYERDQYGLLKPKKSR